VQKNRFFKLNLRKRILNFVLTVDFKVPPPNQYKDGDRFRNPPRNGAASENRKGESDLGAVGALL